MTKAKLIKEICKREGKKSQASIGNVREILRVLEDILAEELADNGSGHEALKAIWDSSEKKAAKIVSKREREAKKKGKK